MSSNTIQHQSRPLIATLSDNEDYIVTHLTGDETVSLGSRFVLSLVASAEVNIKNLGKAVRVIYSQAEEKFHYTGLCNSIQFTGFSKEKQQYFYQLEMVDPLSILAHRGSRQIFQNMTTKQIVEDILRQADLKGFFRFNVSASGKKHEYCVQLDESDQAFIQRLFASEGWHFHIQHSSGKPLVCVGDTNQRFKKIAAPTLSYQVGARESNRMISHWSDLRRVGTSTVSFADHHQSKGDVFDSGERQTASEASLKTLSRQGYAYGHDSKAEARDAAKRQMEALDCDKLASQASSTITALVCGSKFTLSEHPLKSMNQEYLVTNITYQIASEESRSDLTYRNQFTCIPASVTYRPEIPTKPRVHSLHTATVTGPSGEEIYRNKLGGVKVQFHWDRHGKEDENSSCWLPVSQSLASKGFGAQFTPRVGDEVLVQYIDGDPDRPVITGSLYHQNSAPPYSSATQSGIKTRTTPNGSSKQGNELRFDDQKDKEHVYLHAEKDFEIEVTNDGLTSIKGSKTTQVEKTVAMAAKEGITIETEQTLVAKSKQNWTGDSGQDLALKAASNIALEAKSNVSVDGQQVSITGKSKIELSVGGSKIEISASGIKIDAPQVSIAGKSKAEIKATMLALEAQGKADLKGSLVSINGSLSTQVKAGAMVQIQGAIAKVN
ncbi:MULTISPECIES: type VI secretion system Vgr family protein [Vibrio]|nr:type VI secretion system tip protein TssI/VgrG [Vibrio splendidus]KPL97717.1 type IV secretion protein Rhs [Vibrio splendidus]MCC4790738.1 type VI secretion system tip protein VgrG [Vibrio splendidus]MCC4860884.1 type VI secretion system tip protein VgrG [Vibrio splendidus]MDP2592572.1 type VI secretion system tip protein TssI/VgrG [Vibrio splendidus]OEE54296.1 type IV secretion protein Rhs [Vibrio splendidus FF-500]